MLQFSKFICSNEFEELKLIWGIQFFFKKGIWGIEETSKAIRGIENILKLRCEELKH